ncbi:MAG: hypothetical protein JSW50_04500, partial [Candidatus Latescibacterota bacterium]
MRTLLVLACFVMLSSSLSFAQAGGGIQISSDIEGISCNLSDELYPEFLAYFVVHKAIPGSITAASGSQFIASNPPCLQATYLSDTPQFTVTIGDSQSGVTIGYGSCLTMPIWILTMNYISSSGTPPCCEFRVKEHPEVASGRIEVADCTGALLYGAGLCAVVNPDASCPCWATPVEES